MLSPVLAGGGGGVGVSLNPSYSGEGVVLPTKASFEDGGAFTAQRGRCYGRWEWEARGTGNNSYTSTVSPQLRIVRSWIQEMGMGTGMGVGRLMFSAIAAFCSSMKCGYGVAGLDGGNIGNVEEVALFSFSL